jgi:hypothetical protein
LDAAGSEAMKRWTIRIFVFLLLGAIVNVAVAWGCAVAFGSESETQSRLFPGANDEHRPWKALPVNEQAILAVGGWADKSNIIWAATSYRGFLGWRERYFFPFAEMKGIWGRSTNGPVNAYLAVKTADTAIVVETTAGFPRQALGAQHFYYPAGTIKRKAVPARIVHVQALALPSLGGVFPKADGYVVPTGVIWFGFAINTVFYGAVLWMLFAAPFALRKWRRVRRGLCPKCGYDLRGGRNRPIDAAVCPECGATR